MTLLLEKRATVSVEDFDAFLALPENSERRFELINGEIVEVSSNAFVSNISARIVHALMKYLDKHDIGQVTSEAGGYLVSGERFAPDVAYISYARQPTLDRQGYNHLPPELAAEVLSDPANPKEAEALRRKLASYLAAGTVVWVVNPFDRVVEVYQPGKMPIVLDATGTLDGGDLLPGFSAPVSEIMPKPAPPPRDAN